MISRKIRGVTNTHNLKKYVVVCILLIEEFTKFLLVLHSFA